MILHYKNFFDVIFEISMLELVIIDVEILRKKISQFFSFFFLTFLFQNFSKIFFHIMNKQGEIYTDRLLNHQNQLRNSRNTMLKPSDTMSPLAAEWFVQLKSLNYTKYSGTPPLLIPIIISDGPSRGPKLGATDGRLSDGEKIFLKYS